MIKLSVLDNYYKHLVTCIALCFLLTPIVEAQKILGYGPEELTASIHYNEFLYGIYKNYYKNLPDYPVKGVYSPTLYLSLIHI